jgi:hypothetical protein
MRYSQPYTQLLASTAATGRQEFSMNSLFDPDFTGTGAQPAYFDQLSLLYNRYRVYGSAIKVIEVPFNAGVQSNVPVTLVVVPSAISLASFSTYDAAGLPRSQTRVCTGNMDSKNQTIIASHSISEILGVKDVEGADRLQAQVTASPAEQCLWSIIARTVDSVTAAYAVINVVITYDCEFYDRQVQTQSFYQKLQAMAERKHAQELKQEMKEIDAYQKLHKTFEPVELKDLGSLRGPTLSNGEMHEKWLKLREVDDLARETPKSRPPSRK